MDATVSQAWSEASSNTTGYRNILFKNHLENLLLLECTRIIAEHPANHESHDSSLKFYVLRLYSQTFKAFIDVHHENNF